MINAELFNPQSIVVVGASNNTAKPGGKVLENLKNGGFKNLYVLNPGQDCVQEIKSFKTFDELPATDMAILAIPAEECLNSIKSLTAKGVKSYIILSAGFSEYDEAGTSIEDNIKEFALKNNLTIFGPNCIGIINENYKGAFTLPIPKHDKKGVEFVSSSGSTAVFVMEAGVKTGLSFSNIYSVGNAMMIEVEDILEYLDNNFNPATSSKIIAIYIEQISDAQKLIRHCRSLRQKGCNIVGIKSGVTEAGGRAASSHTGAMATPELFVEAIFRKAGIIQCESREEMLYIASVLYSGIPQGKNLVIVTHAGGVGVMCSDALEKNQMKVPKIEGTKAEELLKTLHKGSSVSNPIDFLATGTADQLSTIIDYCNTEFQNIDSIIVIFGSPGLFDVKPVYEVLINKIKNSLKPIYPVLPSSVNTSVAMDYFVEEGMLYFADEVILAKAIAKAYHSPTIYNDVQNIGKSLSSDLIQIIQKNKNSFLTPEANRMILDYFKIPIVEEHAVRNEKELAIAINSIDFPTVMKIVGPLHKTESGGVVLNITNVAQAKDAYNKIMNSAGAEAVLIQAMLTGHELYIGAKKDKVSGHLIMFGSGGIYLEALKDTKSVLLPADKNEILEAISTLKTFPVLQGMRGQKGINIDHFADIIIKISELLISIPEISEMDLNPLIASGDKIIAVDSRIRIE
jgi:acetyltransferase